MPEQEEESDELDENVNSEYANDPDRNLILFSRLPVQLRSLLLPLCDVWEGSGASGTGPTELALRGVKLVWVVQGTVQLNVCNENVGVYEAPAVLCDVAQVLTNHGSIKLDPFRDGEDVRLRILSADLYKDLRDVSSDVAALIDQVIIYCFAFIDYIYLTKLCKPKFVRNYAISKFSFCAILDAPRADSTCFRSRWPSPKPG